MMARSHVPFAITWWWGYALFDGNPHMATGMPLAAIGGLLPDIDHPRSTFGRTVPFLSIPISAVFGHRGITHSLLAVVAIAATLTWATTTIPDYAPYRWMVAPLCVGYLSHILGDWLTPSGVPLLWPRKTTYSAGLFRTGGWKETLFTTILLLLMLGVGGTTDALHTNVARHVDAIQKAVR